jgi:Dolichyl-phosphate-mannose-protein mannosyltransferase
MLEEQVRSAGDRPWVYPAAVALGVVVVAVVLQRYAFTIWSHTLDDDVYRLTGRSTFDNLPSALWSTTEDQRGLQRLQAWLLGFGPGIFGAPGGFRVVRWVDILAYLSAVIPVYRWIRAFDVHPAWAVVGALLAIVTPWAVVTSTFMTEPLAYPLAIWALYLSWKAAVRPTIGALVKAGVVILVAALARSVLLLIGPILVLAMVAAAIPRARGAWAARREWTARQIAPWALVFGTIAVLALLYFADRSALDPLTGVYGSTVLFSWSPLPRLARLDLAYVVSGIGILPGIVAIAWTGKTLVRPARPESLALAVMAVAMTAFVGYSTMRAGPDERYIMYLAPVLIVAAAVALGRREIGPVGLLVGTALTIWLFACVSWKEVASSFEYYISAAQVFHGRILLLNVGSRLPDVGLSYEAILAIGIVVVMAVAAFAVWRRGTIAIVIAGALAVGLAVLQLAQLTYVDRRFSTEGNFGPAQLAAHSWVDDAVGGDATVGVFVTKVGTDLPDSALYDTWREVAFFNEFNRVIYQIEGTVGFAPMYGKAAVVTVDERTGALQSTIPFPTLMMELRINPKMRLAGQEVATGGYVPYALLRTDGRPRLRWLVTGSDDASWTVPGQPTTIKVYKNTGQDQGKDCLTLDFVPPPGLTKPRPVTVRSGAKTYRTRVKPTDFTRLEGVRIGGGDADAYAPVTLQATGATEYQGLVRGVKLAAISRETCR